MDVFQGLKPTGYLLVNTNKTLDDLQLGEIVRRLPSGHARAVPASELAMKFIGRPLPNAALLGAFAALTGIVQLASVTTAIREAFPGKIGEANVAAITAAYDAVAETPVAA
jgi:pyruvate ferredoxin oxidoreductase gamma subunit